MKEQKKLRKESNDEEIAPAVAKCHALRKTGKLLNKVPSMRFKKRNWIYPQRPRGGRHCGERSREPTTFPTHANYRR